MIGQVCDKFDNMFSIGFQYQDVCGGIGSRGVDDPSKQFKVVNIAAAILKEPEWLSIS